MSAKRKEPKAKERNYSDAPKKELPLFTYDFNVEDLKPIVEWAKNPQHGLCEVPYTAPITEYCTGRVLHIVWDRGVYLLAPTEIRQVWCKSQQADNFFKDVIRVAYADYHGPKHQTNWNNRPRDDGAEIVDCIPAIDRAIRDGHKTFRLEVFAERYAPSSF